MKLPLKIPLELAGTSIGMSMFGEALGSEGLKEGGKVAGNFIAPAINISMGGMMIKQLKGIQEEKNAGKTQKEKKKVK
jgi:hypothetical protein